MSGRWIDEQEFGDVRLFCFAHVGGGSGFFRSWRKQLVPEIAVTPVVLPGREARWRESPYTRMDSLIEPLCEAMMPHLSLPFFLFGHSMGAAVAYEVARQLTVGETRSPLGLIVSARRAPHLPARRQRVYDLPADQFLTHLEELNGTAPNLLREPALVRALMPVLRADFEVDDTYSPTQLGSLPISISAFVGDRDQLVDAAEMRAWGGLTAGEFSLRVFDGDHFYLAGEPLAVLGAIRHEVRRAIRLAG